MNDVRGGNSLCDRCCRMRLLHKMLEVLYKIVYFLICNAEFRCISLEAAFAKVLSERLKYPFLIILQSAFQF